MKPPSRIERQKIAVGLYVLFTVAAMIAVDVFACAGGDVATISQVCLTIYRRFWVLTYLTAIGMGILLAHFAVPRDLARGVDPPFWRQAVIWAVCFLLGMWIKHHVPFLSQKLNVD